MRPIRLELKGFTAYREPQVLDLRDLDLFAITGPTGSGKSSLLDAMTFALYGSVPRVGNRTGQLISQGQPRLSVMLEFEADGSRYRVTRTTGVKAQSTIRLERAVHGDWESYGEGADRIREANDLIKKLVGLDYPAFTRSVVLPQGEFAEFMKGDAQKRREILTELLGLELFERMAGRANDAYRSAKDRAAAKAEAASQHDVDAQAVKAARKAAREAAARGKAMAAVGRTLGGIAKQWQAEARRAEALVELAAEAESLRTKAAEIDKALQRLEAELSAGDRRVEEADVVSKEARAAADAAASAYADTEERLGTLEQLAELRAMLSELTRIDGRIASADAAVAAARATSARREKALAKAGQARGAAQAALKSTGSSREEAQREHDRLHRADLVGALTQDLHPGDPCPVCSQPLDRIPATDAKAFARAGRALDTATEAEAKASSLLQKAERDATAAERDAHAAGNEVERCGRELEVCREERARIAWAASASFDGELPADPVKEVDARTVTLRRLAGSARQLGISAVQAEQQAQSVRDAAQEGALRRAELVTALRSLPFAPLIERARAQSFDVETPPALMGAIPADPKGALAAAGDWADGVAQLAAAMSKAAESVQVGMEALVDEAREALPPGVPMGLIVDLDDLLNAVRATTMELVAEAAERKKDAERLAEQLAMRTELEKEVAALLAGASVYQALAMELRADRLLNYLQKEALELLALAGSDRLLSLSQGRYRLAFDQDEFFVEDRQNGDDRRSVKTLSGGETFLASLALALALSEHIQDLAVERRARLESLFIDEGFGALDPESLEVATEALEQLGGDGRMVCVITHVKELAEQMPVRIEVEKLPTGSRLHTVS